MATQGRGFYEFLQLNRIMQEDYCRRVVADALSGRPTASAETRSRITAAIKQWVVIPGFRRGKAHTAVLDVLLPFVVREFHKENEVAAAVLQIWLETKQNLQVAVTNYLEDHHELEADAINWEVGFGGLWTSESMEEASEQFRKVHPDFDYDDASLMLCLKLGRLPIPADEMQDFTESDQELYIEEQDATDQSPVPSDVSESIWQKQLENLRDLPPEAAEWDHIEDLGLVLKKLAEAKIKARGQYSRDVLRLLQEISQQARKTVEYFEFADVLAWDPSSLTMDQAKPLVGLLEGFKAHLLTYQSINQQVAGTLAEERQKRSQLESTEQEIYKIYADLKSNFQESTPKETIQAEPAVKESSEESVEKTTGTDLPLEKPGKKEIPGEAVVPLEKSVQDKKKQRGKGVSVADEEKEKAPEETPSSPPTQAVANEPQKESLQKAETVDQESLPRAPKLIAEPGQSISISAARSALGQVHVAPWEDLVWALIIDDDLIGAYWLVKAAEAGGRVSAIPSWLLKAIQGARWIDNEDHAYVGDLLEISKNHSPDTSSVPIGLLALSAALKPSLVAPFSGLSAWLQKPHFDALDKITDAVTTFLSETGSALHVEDVDGIAGSDQRSNALSQTINEAKQWLAQAPQRRIKFFRASAVWHRLVGPKGELYELVRSAADDRTIDLKIVQDKVDSWRTREYVIERINKIDAENHKIKENPITGAARDTLEGHIHEAISLVSRWCSLARHQLDLKAKGNWIFSQVLELRNEISNNLAPALSILDEMAGENRALDERAAALCLQRSLIQVAEILQISAEPSSPSEKPEGELLAQTVPSLSGATLSRLLLLPELDLSDQMEPSDFDLERMPDAIATAVSESRSLGSAFVGWVKKQDFRFMDFFECRHEAEYSLLLQEAENSSLASLHDMRTKLQSDIEQMIVDGIITDEERARFSNRVEQIDPEQVRNFALQFETLRGIASELASAKEARLDALRAVWKETSSLLQASRIISAEKQQRIIKALESALSRSDTRLVEEYISRIKPVIDAKMDWDESWDRPTVNRDAFGEFLQYQTKYDEEREGVKSLDYVGGQILEGATYAGIAYGRIARPRREEAKNAIDAWRHLKQLRQRNDPLTREYIKHVLTYLGFAFNTEAKEPLKIESHGEDWLYAQASMSDFSLAKPIYQFGSYAQGKYHAVLLWERPGADTIASRLRQLGLKHKNVLLFYLGRLGIKQRGSLIKLCYEDKFNLVILDEVLLVFLAQERDARLPAFLQCALPFAALNPYTPFQAGDVPPEMFYGREEMIRELQDPKGSCLLYGGRQLGKSALLKQVERGFHNPKREQYAAVVDIKLLGSLDGQQSTEAIWRKIRDAFKEFGIIPPEIRTNKPEEIEKNIRRAVTEKSERRILVMFDEADNFLDADARERFAVTERFRTLMLETNRQFKVVFAGLHNVQRFQGLPNQPFAHFGTPLLVGPLDPTAAISLIQEPMHFLGYRFSDSSGPLRILSFTNYHPGLIQLFCQELIERINRGKPNKTPPYEITQEDIEAIYRQVKERIKERFDWTLALDQAYQAIAWTMIYDQIQTRDSYAHTYPASDILAKLKEYLPKRFDKTTHDELTGLLQEMQGLGVLVRDSDGSYRLRSPNVVRLMGSETEILTKLVELMDRPPTAKFAAGSYHALLSRNLFSPLTYDEERHLNSNKSGVCLIFASVALGLKILPDVLKKIALVEDEDTTSDVEQIPLWVSSGSDLGDWLEKFQEKSKNKEQLFVYYSLDASSLEEMKDLVSGAVTFCAKRRAKQVLRVVFIFNPEALHKWLGLDSSILKKLEDQVDVALFPKAWNTEGIRHHLELINMVASDVACQDVVEATGGWPILLEQLLERIGTKDNNPREEAHRLARELKERTSEVSISFRRALGLDEDGIDCRILKYLIELGDEKIPFGFVSPEMLSIEGALTKEDCAKSLEFLTRINCLQGEADCVSVNPIVKGQFGGA